jgi:hypothetical protein
MPHIEDVPVTSKTTMTAAEDMTETLHRILESLERMDRRDRLRTWGGFVRTLLSIIPMVIFLLSTWYLYQNMDEILTKVTKQAAQSAAEYSKNSSKEFLDSIKGMIPKQ